MGSEKTASLISENLAEIINKRVEFESDLMVSIAEVRVDAKLTLATVFIDCFPEAKAKEAIKLIYKKKEIIRKDLGSKTKLRKVPHLRFYFDKSELEGEKARQEIDEILEKIKNE